MQSNKSIIKTVIKKIKAPIKVEIKQTNESDDSSDESPDESSESQDIQLRDFLDCADKIVFSENRIVYKCKISYLVDALNKDEILLSENNRIVDNSRLETFENFDLNKCDPIILAKRVDKDSKYEIIDGQHRMSFFKNLKQSICDITDNFIPVDVRICFDEDDFKKYIDSANNRKNFTSDQLRSNKFPILRDLLNKEFKNNLFTSPYIKINEEDLKNQIFKTKFFEDFNNIPEVIFIKIMKINIFFKNIPEKNKLSLDKDMTKKSYIKERDMAEKINMFIGLDKKLTWTLLLDLEESEWSDFWNELYQNRRKIKK